VRNAFRADRFVQVIANPRFEAQFGFVKQKGDAPTTGGLWTRPDAYVDALVRRRSSRKSRTKENRTEPEAPRFSLSTLPFLILMGALLVIAVGIIVAAWPGTQPQPNPKSAAKELGTAQKGWFQEAQKEFHGRG
jgi:hypothetical protein